MTRVHIYAIAAGGDGVGRLEDGAVVFVPRTAPGDVVDVDVVERKRRYARGRMTAIVEAGSVRVEPPCPHYRYDDCGGCQLQHLAPTAQLDAKRRLVGDALRRIGHLDVADPEIVAAPDPWRYRSKITLGVGEGRVGLHPIDRPTEVFALDDCPITREPLMDVWRALRAHRSLLPETLRTLVLREDRDGRLHVVAEGEGTEPWDAGPLARAVGDGAVVYWWRSRGAPAQPVAGSPGGFPVLAFEQPHARLAGWIRRDAIGGMGRVEGRCVWDLYGGVGDTAELLAEQGARVWCVDADRNAVAWGERRSSERPHGSSVRRIAARAEDVLPRLPEPDAVVVNPPRHGLHRRVTSRLARWASERAGARLVYVSCDPATLARDLSRLPALVLRRLRAYDLFPQTSHVEALAVLEAA